MPFSRRRPPHQPHAHAGDAEDSGAVSLTSLREKLIKIGATVVRHGRCVTFQMAKVALPRQMFADILALITRLRHRPHRHDQRQEQCGMQAAMEKVCLDPGKRGAFGVWPPSATGFDRLWISGKVTLRCPSRSKTQSRP
jgi:hypothetical protein